MVTLRVDALRELWIHAGTSCNLSCPFCHEGAKPGDTRLEAITLAEAAPLIDQAVALGAHRIAFTGGEPLILRGIDALLGYALERLPVLVLTNGTAPFIRRSHQLAALRARPHPAIFRVSLDYADEARHDAGRGLRNFRKAIEGIRLLLAAGFAVQVARQSDAGEDSAAVDAAFRALLKRQRLPADLPLQVLPPLGALGEAPALRPATATPAPPACTRSRMLVKRAGALQLAPCPLVDDRPDLDLAPDLEAAIRAPISPVHARCTQCLNAGVNYVGAALVERV